MSNLRPAPRAPQAPRARPPLLPRLARLAPVLALALVVPLAGCSGGGERPRFLVGDGPPADEWGLIGTDASPEGGGGETPATPAPQPPRRADRDGGRHGDGDRDDGGDGDDDDGDDDSEGEEGGGDGDGEDAARTGTLLALAAGETPGTFVVVGHAEDADWGDVAVAADAGTWTLVLEGGTPGRYDFGEGLMASPAPGEVQDGDVLRFCDRSTADGVTASYVQVDDVPGGDTLLRERVQPAC
jgi:hypothetical protein